MPRSPGFWQHDGFAARVLSPFSALTSAVTARRVARPGWRAPVPVLCCGNVTVGGAGKTTLVLDLAQRLIDRGHAVHILLRGYGGRLKGPHRVASRDTCADVGDEALLLAALAPTWVGADRAASARAAVAGGAEVLLMDDGLQHPSLIKDIALLVVDGSTGFGNRRVLPAGPLREPVGAGVARCDAAVLIGDDATGVARSLGGLPILRASLIQEAAIRQLRGKRVLAFAGIAHPAKFFTPLAAAGAILAERHAFADHHAYTRRDLDRLTARAEALDAVLATTPKDAVRLPPAMRSRVHVVGVGLAWDDPPALDALLDRLFAHAITCGKEHT